ncbi:hypothetical protein AB1Y20_013363 [Prymnesium parvum]|uniref:Uncharacterized protein n=1 Tax=Prymnesium parvum TaxID=97485 RepID=A0AB34II20_PRYPA
MRIRRTEEGPSRRVVEWDVVGENVGRIGGWGFAGGPAALAAWGRGVRVAAGRGAGSAAGRRGHGVVQEAVEGVVVVAFGLVVVVGETEGGEVD